MIVGSVLVGALLLGGGAGVAGAAAWQEWGSDEGTTSGGTSSTSSIPVVDSGDAPAQDGSVEQVAAEVLPSVVKINVVGESEGQPVSGSGSGIILSEDGEILTNNHVVELAGDSGRISVSFQNGDEAAAKVLGTDPLTAAALRRNTREAGDEFPTQLRDLLDYFAGTHPQIIAATAAGNRPEMWLLGSSDYSAHAAGLLGLPFSFAHHFASAGTAQALQTYRESFRPSQFLEQPYSMIGVPVICAPTSDDATYLSGPSALSFLNLRQGRPIQMCSPEEAAQHEFTPMEREIVRGWHAPLVMGDPQQVRTQLDDLVDRFGVDELMLTTMVYDQADRLRSYELVAEAWNLAPAAAA